MTYEGFFEALAAVLSVACVGFFLFLLYGAFRSAADRRRYAAAGGLPPEGPGTSAWVRKAMPYAAALAGVLLVIYGQQWFYYLMELRHGVPAAGTFDATGNATGAEVAAGQQAGGWVQPGALLSKVITASTFFFLFSFLPWVVQQLTHPAPNRWAKQDYSRDFDALTDPLDKFRIYQGIGLNATIKAAAAMLAAALIQ